MNFNMTMSDISVFLLTLYMARYLFGISRNHNETLVQDNE